MKNIIALFSAVFVSAIFSYSGFAQQATKPDAIRTMSYQGLLLDAAKHPVTGSHHITIRLYDAPLGGNILHSENFTSDVANGIFNVVIGSEQPVEPAVRFDKRYWVGVSVDDAGELSPRTALTSVPYAIRSDMANSLAKGATGAVTSVNGRSGDLTIKGGNGTFVQAEGNTITITAIQSGSLGNQQTQQTFVNTIAGTTNQVNTSASTGNVTLSLPQDIHNGASPKFAGMSLTNFATAGIIHNNSLGALSSSLLVNADVSSSAAIADTKLAIISTSGKVANSATSANSANTANTIVLRDGSGNFNAGTISAASITLSGKATSAATVTSDPSTTLTTKDYVDNSAASAWSTNGNTGISSGNFIGTTDANNLSFRTSATERMKITADGSLLLSGLSGSVPDSGFGTRMMWIPSLGAFRAGKADASEWNPGNIGNQSVAMGYGVLASGAQSVAMGFFTSAYGMGSTAMGSGAASYVDGATALGSAVQAVGYNSVAMGDNTTAWGDGSTALGSNTNSYGIYSTAMGYNTMTTTNYGTSMGKNLTVGLSSFGFNGSTTNTTVNVSAMNNVAYFGDVDMIIGNDDNNARSLRFYGKNSAATLTSKYTAFKAGTQAANITYTLPLSQGASGSVLTNNGSGSLSWVAPSITPYGTVSAGAAITIPGSTSVIKITADADSTANAITLPSGTNGQIIYIYNDDSEPTSGDAVINNGATGIFIYADGWRKAN